MSYSSYTGWPIWIILGVLFELYRVSYLNYTGCPIRVIQGFLFLRYTLHLEVKRDIKYSMYCDYLYDIDMYILLSNSFTRISSNETTIIIKFWDPLKHTIFFWKIVYEHVICSVFKFWTIKIFLSDKQIFYIVKKSINESCKKVSSSV